MAQTSKRNRNLPQQLTLDHVSPATRLLEKRRQMFEVQEALDAQKEEFARRETTFKRREEMLKSKDRELQESLIKFNKFLQDNDSKRNRAEKKEKEEIKLRVTKEQEIVRLLDDLRKQKEKRQMMMAELEKMMTYQTYLEGVLDVADEHAEISELLSRYDTLEAAHLDLMTRSRQAGDQQESQRSELQQFIRDKTDEILGYNNKIAELQKLSEKSSEQTLLEQANSERLMSDVAERKLQLGQVMMACENIYQRCCDRSSVQRKRLHATDADDAAVIRVLIEKLHLIRENVLDLTAITRGWRPPLASETSRPAPSPARHLCASVTLSSQPAAAGAAPPVGASMCSSAMCMSASAKQQQSQPSMSSHVASGSGGNGSGAAGGSGEARGKNSAE